MVLYLTDARGGTLSFAVALAVEHLQEADGESLRLNPQASLRERALGTHSGSLPSL